MTWNYGNLSAVHLELSTKCNAACPGCPRFLRNSPNVDPTLIQTEITLENFKKWFPVEITSKIYNWIVCGTHGDPVACKDLYEILQYICENSSGNIQVNTNAGLKSPAYFKKIGELFNRDRSVKRVVTFSIDGLQDTNHIYRRNVKWHKAWENMLSYKSTGAEAHWDFLQFDHNKHQIEEAKALAKKYDINFILKNPFGVDGEAMPVYDKNYNLEYLIKNAHNPVENTYIPPDLGWEAGLPKQTTEEGHIECMSFRNGDYPYHEMPITEIYVNALGRVHPCCFVGNKMQGPIYMEQSREMRVLQEKLGDSNSLNFFSLKEILDSKVLDVYSNSWESKSISTCWLQCGKNASKKRKIDILFVKE